MMKHDLNFPISFLHQYHLTQTTHIVPKTFDIIYIISGQIIISSSKSLNRTYASGNVFTLHSNQDYVLEPAGNNIILHLGILLSFLEEYVGQDSLIVCDSVLEPNRNHIILKRLLSSIASQYLDNFSSHKLSIYGLLFQLMDCLHKDYLISLPDNPITENEKYQDRIQEIQNYIYRNYNQPITLASLADSLSMSQQYLSKYFKKHFHVKFNEYLNHLRIQHALRDICYTNDSITDIALRHGFFNATTFSKLFRSAYQISPRDYRKKYHQTTTLDYDFPMDSTETTHLISSNFIHSRQISVDVQHSTPVNCNYCKLINIGSAGNLLFSGFQKQFADAKSKLNFCFVRLENLISDALIPTFAPDNQYYFADVTTILDFLYEQNTLPFIELGKRLYHKNRQFQSMLSAFLEFITLRYDSNWYSQWIFEFGKVQFESVASYIKEYQEIHFIIHQYIPSAKLGGPGYDTCLKQEEFTSCLEAFYNENIFPDFVSAHFFEIQHYNEVNKNMPILPPDKDSLLKKQKWILKNIKEVLKREIPLYITEFNSSILADTFINYSCYQAAFLCYNLLNLHEHSELIGYRMLSDLAYNPKKLTTGSQSRISLIAKSGIKMPAFYAYELLNKLGGSLIEQGENFCITQSEYNHYQILAYQFAYFSNHTFLQETDLQSFKNVYTIFEEVPPVQINFQLTGLKPGVYRIRRYLLDRSHGSALDIQLGGLLASNNITEDIYLHKIDNPSPKHLQYLSQACIPEERTIYLDITTDLNVITTLSAHTVCLWDIVREI